MMSKLFKYSAGGALILMMIAEICGLVYILSQPWINISPVFFVAGCALFSLTIGLLDLVMGFES